jgi:hypothetical protein
VAAEPAVLTETAYGCDRGQAGLGLEVQPLQLQGHPPKAKLAGAAALLAGSYPFPSPRRSTGRVQGEATWCREARENESAVRERGRQGPACRMRSVRDW